MKKLTNKTRRLNALFTGAFVASCVTTGVKGQAVYRENFDGLTLGPNVEEALAGAKVWTRTPPTGWTADNSKVPGFGDPTQDGVTEWAGWSFANKDWWVTTAGDQRRSEFVFGQGTVMVSDPDEWDDATHAQGFLEEFISTSPIGITNSAANSLVLVYDSSWRPEAKDDGLPSFPVDSEGNNYNDQTAAISATFDGAAPIEIQRWTSVSDDATFHDHFPNEAVVIPLSNPAGAKNLVLKFGMEKSANDWWWAVDNLAVGTPPFASGISANGVSFTVRIVEALGKSVDQSKGVGLELDGAAVTGVVVAKDGDFVTATYTQTPVFAPGSHHSVKVKYTSNENKASEETLEFIAPTYVSLSATPGSVLAAIKEADWMKVDESKGIKFSLDGANVTPVTVARADTVINASAVKNPPFASGSDHTLNVTFTAVGGQELVETVTFTAPAYPTIPTSLATAAGTGAQAGMRWRTHMLDTNRGNTISEAEAQLAGTKGVSIHNTEGQGADGYFPIDFVNFDQNAGDAGNFNSAAAAPQDVADLAIPGIDLGGPNDNIAGEALTFVEFTQPGIYTMVVNSDDGFQLSTGTTNNPTQLVLSKFDAGRGAADTAAYFKVDQAGVYFFRLLWFEGGSDARVEWFTVNADGSRALVNGTQTGSLKSYRVRTVAEPGGGSTGAKIISLSLTGGKLVIDYAGTLYSSTTINGTFQPVAGAAKPYNASLDGKATFFLAR